MILTVSLDESGTHAGSPISVMAGNVGYGGAMEARRGGLPCVLKTLSELMT
jgi:hypothetical protein